MGNQKAKRQGKYSVLLLYPLSIANGGAESYYTHVQATDVKGAVRNARRQLMRRCPTIESPADIPVCLVLRGHHVGLTYEYT